MTQWLAGMRITAARLNDNTPVALATSPTAATNFTVVSFSGENAGGQTTFAVVLNYTGASAITGTSTGNITPDVACCTLPPNCRPQATMFLLFDKAGVAAGSLRVAPTGICTLVSLYPTATITNTIPDTVNFSGTLATG
jgi:hypothetical protein